MPLYYPRRSYQRRPVTTMVPTRYSGGGAYYPRRSYSVRRYRGSGAYSYDNPGPWGRAGRMGGAAFGSSIGSRFGPIGSKVGGWLGEKVGGLAYYPAKWFGSGAYTRRRKGKEVLAPDKVRFSNSGNSVLVTHTEYIKDLISSQDANTLLVESLGINAGDLFTFPWLATLCGTSFSQYRFEQLIFEFRSSSGEALNSTNTALGSVMACINYDYNDEAPTTRFEIENCDWSKSEKPSCNFLIPVECKKSETSFGGLLYVLNQTAVPTGADPKTYYMGRLNIATDGLQGTSVKVGSLYVSYTVRLFKPIMAKALSQGHVVAFSRSGADNTNRMGTAFVSSAGQCDSIGVDIDATAMLLNPARLRPGMKFIVYFSWIGSSTASLTVPAITASQGCEKTTIWTDSSGVPFNTTSEKFPLATATNTAVGTIVEITITGTDEPPSISIGSFTPPTSAVLTVKIFQVSSLNEAYVGSQDYIAP